jgi:hypothetical protein
MGAQVRLGRGTGSVVPQGGAQVRLGRGAASVTPAASGGARIRLGRGTASVVPPSPTASGEPVWLLGQSATPGATQLWLNGAPVSAGQQQEWLNGAPFTPGVPPTPPTPIPAVAGYTLVVADEFAILDPTRWYAYDNSTYGSDGGRIQRYMARNVTVGLASDGDGYSLKMVSKREAVGGNPFTAGMLDTKTAGWLAPRYHCKEIDARISHGQGIWQAWWSTAFTGGADMVELDDMEIFHAQVPGRALLTLHRATGRDSTGKLLTQYNVAKSKSADGYGGIFFEAPTATPGGRHKFRTKVWPVTDATGATPGNPNLPSANVRIQGYIDGVLVFDYVDTNALYWTTNGGDPADPVNRFWNFYLQGSQIDGKYVGHPDDPLGYSHILNACISTNGGTAPNACATSFAGQPIIRAQFPNTFEIYSHTVWKYTG